MSQHKRMSVKHPQEDRDQSCGEKLAGLVAVPSCIQYVICHTTTGPPRGPTDFLQPMVVLAEALPPQLQLVVTLLLPYDTSKQAS